MSGDAEEIHEICQENQSPARDLNREHQEYKSGLLDRYLSQYPLISIHVILMETIGYDITIGWL
jgi:hypothetical protein